MSFFLRRTSFLAVFPMVFIPGTGVLAQDAALTALPAAPAASALALAPISINIDGRLVESDPAPLLDRGAVYVPLRGVLEKLGAKVNFLPADRRIEIDQGSKTIVLHLGQSGAVVGTQAVALAPPKMVAGRAFVPLRALAELFGFQVAWLAGSKTVAIVTGGAANIIPADHRAALKQAGPFGVEVDFSQATPEDVTVLLDAAKGAGASLVKTRFDWHTLQPTETGEFQWPIYDRVVREARERGLVVVGILGNTAQWASVSSSSDAATWRQSPPREAAMPLWSNYVKRVVGRYKNDVQAWQVWENPTASNFRSVARTYRQLARLAVEAARQGDAKAIVHAAEPGGVSLDFISDLGRNGLTPLLDGISVYPVSGWQPGTLTPAENFLLSYATLQERLKVADGKTRDYWVGGLSYPTLEAAEPAPQITPIAATPEPAPNSLLQTFSAQNQADYLVRAMSLALASGTEKAFWSQLRDPQTMGGPEIAPNRGTGLLRADGTPRPALSAFKNLTQLVGNKPYAGNLALGQGVVALLFDDKKSGVLVAWSPAGAATLALSSQGVNANLPNALFVAARPDSQVLSSTGAVVGTPDGPLQLSQRPVFITNVALETAQIAATRGEKPLRLTPGAVTFDKANQVSTTFGKTGGEDGLFWRKYADFGAEARQIIQKGERFGLTTESQRDVMDLMSSRPFIHLDVADDFLFFEKGVPVEVQVEVFRPAAPQTESIFTSTAGFRIEYSSATGPRTTQWQQVEAGEGWTTLTFSLPDASFSNAAGHDLLLNAGGSKADLTFGTVTVKKLQKTP